MKKRKVVPRHSSKHHALHPLNLPPGIKVLIAYTGIIALFYLLYLLFGITKPISVVFGTFVYGNLAILIEFSSLFVLFAIIYGLVKRHFWVFYVSIVWFLFGLLNAVISLTAFKSEFDVLKHILFASSFVVIILNGIIAWYIYSEKYYFKTKHLNKQTKTKDKFFVYLISVFLIVSILVLITYGVNFYNTTLKTTSEIISELKAAQIPDLECAQKTGQDQDICYLILSIMKEGKQPTLCENINSDFYKVTCYRSLE